LIVTGLAVTGVSQTRYFDAAAPLHWLLLPAFALLAVPLKRFFPRIQRHPEAVLAAVAIGGPVACLSAILLPFLAGVAPEITASLAPKSVTTSVAVDITQALGGLPGLTAVVVVTTGLVGMSLGPPLFQALRIRDEAAQGLALGIAAHALGTAKAFEISKVAGAYATVGLILNALVTTVALSLFASATGT
jgi:putative effector of murein hydrolase